MKTTLQCAIVLVAVVFSCQRAVALTSPAAPIAPGDIIFTEFFEGWHKLDPVSGVVTPLPWPESSTFTNHIAFDTNGAILFDDFGGAVNRLHPVNGNIVPLNVPSVSLTDGFVVEAMGDLLIANSGAVSRFTRTTGLTTTVTGGSFFSPNGIARGADGRVFITEFFEDLWEVNPATGARSLVTSTELSIPGLIAVRSDGNLIVENFSPNVFHLINPNSGAVTLFSDDLPTFVEGIALDASDNLWVTSTDGVFRYDSAGGAKTLIADGTFFSPAAIAVVPQGWTAPIPEPTGAALAAIASLAVFGRRRQV